MPKSKAVRDRLAAVHGAAEVALGDRAAELARMKAADPEALRAAARKQRAIALARTDVNAFIEYVLSRPDGGAVKQGAIHREWQALADVHERLLVVAPRGHWKTGQFAIGRVLFLLGRNPNELIKIICQSDRKATKRLSEIRDHLKSNPRLREVFPHLGESSQDTQDREWNKHLITVNRTLRSPDPSIEAMGITSSASGDRATVLIFDDVVDRRNAITLPRVREAIKASFDDWYNLLLPTGRAIYICTLWHKGDLSHALIANPEWSVAWYEIDLATLGSTVRLPDGTERRSPLPLWGDACGGPWSTEALAKRRKVIGERQFARGFGNRPAADEERHVKPEWIHYCGDKIPDSWPRLLALDLAPTAQGTSDPTGFAILAVSPPPPEVAPAEDDGDLDRALAFEQVEALEAPPPEIRVEAGWHERLTWPEKISRVKALHEKFGFEWIVVELAAGGHEFAEHLLSTSNLPIRGVKVGSTNKAIRLDRITPYLENEIVTFDARLDPRVVENKRDRGCLVEELVEFPLYDTDNILDAFVHGVRFATVVYEHIGGQVEDGDHDPENADDRERGVTDGSVLIF